MIALSRPCKLSNHTHTYILVQYAGRCTISVSNSQADDEICLLTSLFLSAPVNLSVVPPNLRSFVTPSIRRVYIDNAGPQEAPSEPEQEFSISEASCSTSESSELARLRAENHALRNNCLMWRKRAETHGAANLGLLNFARVVRDQASILARERDELRKNCSALKRKIDEMDDRLSFPTII